ncbi:MAG TPA: NUDIX domain-containing protein [Tepidisphaeraceae bacterium]|nr:NUDIX domain-containing protein [Tepidisphaeraceae bacterium]
MNVRHDMVTVFVARAGERAGGREFLQLRRRAGDVMGGTWQTVRGGIEAGETAVEAAVRELREETGLTAAEWYQLSSIDSFYIAATDTIWHCPVLVAITEREHCVKLNAEHDDWRWVPQDQVTSAFMWPRERELIAETGTEIFRNSPATHLRIRLTPHWPP